MPDRYEQSLRVLGLEPGATERAVKDAYRDLVKVWHPDRFGSDARLRAKAQERLKDVNAAFEQLRGYDGSHCKGAQEPARPVSNASAFNASHDSAPPVHDHDASDFRGPRPAVRTPGRVKSVRSGPLLILTASAALMGIGGTVLFMTRNRAPQLSPPHDPIGPPAAMGPARLPPSRHPARRGAEPLPSSAVDDARESAAAARTGSLSLASRPTGARVSIDGHVVGETPIRVTEVTPGEHHVDVTLEPDTYERWSSQVVVTAGHEEKLLAVLMPTERVRATERVR